MKENKEKLDKLLKWARHYCKKNRLKLNGFWTYDNDYFSWEYLSGLVSNEYIVINKELGKKPEPQKMDVGEFEGTDVGDFLKEISAKNLVQPWYYKGKGKIFRKHVLKKEINKFKKTKEILKSKSRKIGYSVHADWWGAYFLVLAALAGKSFHEKTFQTEELYSIREFIEKERPKGAVLSYITSDKACPIYDISLSPILNLFDIPELKYLKLLFVSKHKPIKNIPFKKAFYDKKVEWVLAYSK